MLRCALALCGLTLFVLSCHSANIAVYIPLPYYSHQLSFKPLWLELARRGHKITLIQSDVIIENNENITHIVLNETKAKINKAGASDRLAKGQSIVTTALMAIEAYCDVFEYQLTHPEVQNLLNGSRKVDLFFTEYIIPLGFGFANNVPTIGLASLDASIPSHLEMGNPTHPVMYPDRDVPVSPILTFKDRLLSCIHWFAFQIIINLILYSIQERIIQKGLCVTTSSNNISLLFINANPLFNTERPLTSVTINVGGGFNLLEPQPLPQDLQEYLDSAEEGVIYFSLGSGISSKHISNATKRVILETFKQLPYKILWKFEEEPAGKSQNVKIEKWVPQQDILRHKNVKLFITQGGLQSMEEAIFSYVPMVAMPFFGDQFNNANKMVARGFGLTLDHTQMTAETFKTAILEVINNPSYKKIAKQLAEIIKDQPITGLEKAVLWTEYVLKHGHTNIFKNPYIDIPWYQYLFLDVISFIIMLIIITIYVFTKLVKISIWSTRILWAVTKTKTKTS